ncbi:hypothetical protein D3C72_2033610 [compost metagenome]
MILPEVVIVIAALGDPRNLALFIENIQHLFFHPLEVFTLGETRGGTLVFLFNPRLYGLALQLFQP